MSNYTNVKNKGYINIRFRLKNNPYGRESRELNWCLWHTDAQTDKHIERTEANLSGNGSKSSLVRVFEYECFFSTY